MTKTICTFITAILFVITGLAHAESIEQDKIQVLSFTKQATAHSAFDAHFKKAIKQNLVNQIGDQVDQGEAISVFGETLQWQSLGNNQDNTTKGMHVFKLELSTDRFTKGKLTLEGLKNASLYLNGVQVSGKGSFDLQLLNADHRVLVLAQLNEGWEQVVFNWELTNEDAVVSFNQGSPERRLSPKQMYDSQTFSGLSISPDGEHMVWTKRHYDEVNGDKPVSVTELMATDSRKVLYRWQGMTPSGLSWSSDNRHLSFAKGGNLHLLNLETLELTTIVEGLKGASGYRWLDNNTILFSWTQVDKTGKKNAKRYRALQDRWTTWRNNTQVYQLDIKSGLIAQITKDALSHALMDFDAKNGKILVARSPISYAEPPHGVVELVEVDIATAEEQLINKFANISRAVYTKDGFYVMAGPGYADGAGRAVADDVVVNEYDGQLYLQERDGSVKALSKDFDPAIRSFQATSNNDLIVSAINQDRSQLFLFDRSKGKFTLIDSGLDVTGSFSVSMEKRPTLVMSGTNATSPQKVMLQKGNKKPVVLVDTAKTDYANIKFSSVKDWDFTNKHGELIDGRYYLPPDFDETKKYPAIVYYYGGTTPVTRGFTGRWPFSLWAAKGYVVYVLQPAGTIGYGQSFSAKHVNAWGIQTADDIIASTKAFLAAHPFVDSSKVANMGASYGGFMTMYLATKTDMFAASMSHAGISNLSEYWGFGWWGYAYSGYATKGKFPWNAKDFYVEQSPLYYADQVTTPLLLITGDSDTNVPPSQSHQMYTALKLLGKDVEFVEFIGEDHHINTRAQRLRWWDTILSYLDYKLKDQPLWWNTLYPQPE